MTDLTAGLLTAALILVAVESYRRRETLQPNRAAAAMYLGGTIAWGIALMLLWVAWASARPGAVCEPEACDSLAETIDSASFSGEFLTGQEALNEVLTD